MNGHANRHLDSRVGPNECVVRYSGRTHPVVSLSNLTISVGTWTASVRTYRISLSNRRFSRLPTTDSPERFLETDDLRHGSITMGVERSVSTATIQIGFKLDDCSSISVEHHPSKAFSSIWCSFGARLINCTP